jgi:hypothetical protein
VSDLQHFFRQLVANLSASDPTRLYQALPVADLQHVIIPYRTSRRALALESAEDYEVLLLRLCAGEGGLARTDPPDVQALFQSELAGSNPDLALLHVHGDALVSLSGGAVARALALDPDAAYAPPPAPAEETFGAASTHTQPQVEDPEDELLFEERSPAGNDEAHAADAGGVMCLYCGATLPGGRSVNFCPHCGQSQATLRCPACQAEIELGWRHCVGCGAPVGDR